MSWTCKKGCYECCGIVPVNKETYEKHKFKAKREVIELAELNEKEIVPLTKNGLCVFLDLNSLNNENHCSIYEDRPKVCRNYGIIPELPCPYIDKEGYPRSKMQQKSIKKVINKNTTTKINKIINKN